MASTTAIKANPRTDRSRETIAVAIADCWLGSILVAVSAQGVCAILLGDDSDALFQDLAARFPQAQLVADRPDHQPLLERVVRWVETPDSGSDLPLDFRGTDFQRQVWRALREIPVGSTASYREIANQIGRPRSVRAVAQACAANPLAVVVPCHRVVRSDGSLSGYRWGTHRKAELLRREQISQ